MEKEKLNLKALILVGGFGTRLRPLTFAKPKPLVELCNKPTLLYQIEALVEVGVNEIILAINYQPEKMKSFIEETEKKYNVKIVCSKEDKPLGTAGPIGLARDLYLKTPFDYLFVFNADIVCHYNLKELLNFHIEKKGEGTLCVTKVKDPSRYGVILYDENNKIKDFVEKPLEFISDKINAGLYIFNYEFLNRIETKPYSIEREVFPKMANDGVLFCMELKGFWKDIGQPKDFLEGNFLVLNNLCNDDCNKDKNLNNKGVLKGKVLVGSDCVIEEGAEVGPNVILGDNVVIKSGTKIKNSVALNDSTINSNTFIENTIIGWGSRIGKWCRLKGTTIIGEDVSLADEVSVEESLILPNVAVKKDVPKNSIIIC